MPRTAGKRRSKSTTTPLQRWIAGARETVTDRVSEAQKVVAARVSQARERGAGTLSSLEQVFEKRVSGAMHRLGIPSPREVQALSREVARLQAAVEQLRRRRARA